MAWFVRGARQAPIQFSARLSGRDHDQCQYVIPVQLIREATQSWDRRPPRSAPHTPASRQENVKIRQIRVRLRACHRLVTRMRRRG